MLHHLTREPLDAGALLLAVAAPGCGAQALFVGAVRDRQAGRVVRGIEYSAYERMAAEVLATIERELVEGAPGLQLRIVHRLGELAVGEVSIVIAAAAPHRDAAFVACRNALERVKREAPIWKRERYADGESAWREEERLAPG